MIENFRFVRGKLLQNKQLHFSTRAFTTLKGINSPANRKIYSKDISQ
jgi:hypothetical protein